MKTKILIPFLALAMLPMMAGAQVNYAVSGDTAYVTNSPNATGDISIDSTYDGYPVTSIGEDAFFDCPGLTSVIIPDSVTSIGEDAFYFCTSLTSVTIPDSVTSIGYGAFADCSLTNIIIPDSVTNIGDGAFDGCENLTSITIPDSVTSIGNYAFFGCTSLTNIIIPDSVTSIGVDAFFKCPSLTSVTIPDSVTSIGESAFCYCVSLTSVTIPDSVTNIEYDAFLNCQSLTSVTIGSGVTNIEDDAFEDCPALTSISFLGNAPSIDSTVFSGDTTSNITVYTAPGTTGWAAFASVVGVVTAPQFGSVAYGGSPVLFYPTNGAANTLQLSTDGVNWVTVSNAVTLAALQLTNPPPTAFFRLQASGGSAPDAGLVFYGNLPVLFYPTNANDSLQMATSLATPDWTPPVGNAFISVQVTNAPPNAVFRLH